MLRILTIAGLLTMTPLAIGCSESGGTGGSAGTGGSGGMGGVDLGCNQGECLMDSQAAEECRQLVEGCIDREAPEKQCVIGGLCISCFDCGGAGGSGGIGGTGGSAGTGGAGGSAGTGGAGGSAGTGGMGGSAGTGGAGGSAGTGGTGGSDGLFCDEELCTDPDVAEQCRTAVALCVANGEPEEDCIAAANLIFCNEFSLGECNEPVCRCSTLNTPCNFSCDDGRCNQECEGEGVECVATCAGGGCDQECDRGASCVFSCDGGECKQECENDAASCMATCEPDNCTSSD